MTCRQTAAICSQDTSKGRAEPGDTACGNCGRDIPSNNLVSHSVFCYRDSSDSSHVTLMFSLLSQGPGDPGDVDWKVFPACYMISLTHELPNLFLTVGAEATTTDAQHVVMSLRFGTRRLLCDFSVYCF